MADDGLAEIEAMAARLRGLGASIEAAAPAAAQAVGDVIRANLRAGKAPDGTAWQETKKGNVPLRGAADRLEVRAVGNVILISIGGRYVYHHFGTTGRGRLPSRPVVPLKGQPIPKPVADAIKAALLEAADKAAK